MKISSYKQQRRLMVIIAVVVLVMIVGMIFLIQKMRSANSAVEKSVQALNEVKNDVKATTLALNAAESRLKYFQAVSDFDKGNYQKVIDLLEPEVDRNKMLFAKDTGYEYGSLILGLSYAKLHRGQPAGTDGLERAEVQLNTYLAQSATAQFKDVASENLAMVLADQNKLRQALAVMNGVTTSSRPKSLRVLGYIYLRKGSNEIAEKYFREAMNADQHDFWSALNLYTALARQGRSKDAFEAIRAAKKRYRQSGRHDREFERALSGTEKLNE